MYYTSITLSIVHLDIAIDRTQCKEGKVYVFLPKIYS
jgi:hypothetical protein